MSQTQTINTTIKAKEIGGRRDSAACSFHCFSPDWHLLIGGLGMMLHQSGSREWWTDGKAAPITGRRPSGLIRCLMLYKRGKRHDLQLSLEAGGCTLGVGTWCQMTLPVKIFGLISAQCIIHLSLLEQRLKFTLVPKRWPLQSFSKPNTVSSIHHVHSPVSQQIRPYGTVSVILTYSTETNLHPITDAQFRFCFCS